MSQMITRIRTVALSLGLVASTLAQPQIPGDIRAMHARFLETKVHEFNLTDAIIRDGISELSLKNVVGFEAA